MTPRRRRDLAAVVVSRRRADVLGRTLAGVERWLPGASVHVWSDESPGSATAAELMDRWPRVAWTFSDSGISETAALNALVDDVRDRDVLVLAPGVELLGPLIEARDALTEPGVAVVSPAVQDVRVDDDRVERWDVARRRPSVIRALVAEAAYGPRLRDRRLLDKLSDLYPAPPDEVDGYITGGCLLISRDAWDVLGPFDSWLPGEGAHVSWELAARAAGWSVRLVDDPVPQVRYGGSGTTDDPLVSQRVRDLTRSALVLSLGLESNRGPGALLSSGALLLDRVQRSKRCVRRARLAALTAQARGRPHVVITTNGLGLGGAERQRVILANELVGRGHPVTVVCLQRLGLYVPELDVRVRLALQPWWQPVTDLAGDDAVVVTGVTNTEVGFAMAWRGLGRRRRWLAASHDSVEPGERAYSSVLATAVRRADAMLYLSTAHRDELTAHQRLNSRSFVTPNGVALPVVADRRPSTTVRFGMLTRVVELKNHLLLVEALDGLGRDDWTLDIFGDGPDRARLQARTPEHLHDRVRWRGESPGPDHALREIDVLCLPSRREAFPLVLVEAMVREVAVMGSAVGSIPEMLDHGRAGVVVQPNDPTQWTEELNRMISEPERRARLAAAGKARASSHYTVAAMTDAYEQAIAEVFERPSANIRGTKASTAVASTHPSVP